MGFRYFIINEIESVANYPSEQHNSIYRGRNLGTVSSLNEYIAFRQAHGINDKSYKDLYLGDYFKIQDGTYNVEWMVAHFDYYYNKGNAVSSRGVVLISRNECGNSKMGTTDATGAYLSSIAHTTTCPAIASALQTVLGSYLLSNRLLLTSTMNASTPSMAGAGMTGASTGWTWTSTQCVLPNEIQVYGSTVASSSWYDIGESNEKLAVFNYINHVYSGRSNFWLRSVARSSEFALADASGYATYSAVSLTFPVRPLIYIG